MGIWVPLIFIVAYLLYVVTFTRIRAEAGLPWGFGPDMQVTDLMKATVGSDGFTLQQQVGLHSLSWHNFDLRCVAMPHQLEAFRIGGQAKMNLRHVAAVIMLATIVGALSSWGSILTCYYQYGAATAKVNGWRTGMGNQPYQQMKDWVDNVTKPDFARLQGVGVGVMASAFLVAMRSRFTWWPFHPIGYAVAGTFTMNWLW